MKKQRQRILSLLLALALCLGLVPAAGAEEASTSGSCGPNAVWVLDENGTLTISGSGKIDDYTYSSNSMTTPWQGFEDSITKVVIAPGITSIGHDAFSRCENLTEVELPPTLLEIGIGAFERDPSLTHIDIPGSVATIRSAAFFNTKLTDFTFPSGVTKIDRYLLGSTDLTSLDIPTGITSIGTSAFSMCQRLTHVTIPDTVTEIEDHAFYSCQKLKEIKLPDGLPVIEQGLFRSCRALESVTIPDSVTSIEKWAFEGCYDLKDVYYSGTTAQWEALQIDKDKNELLLSANIHCSDGMMTQSYLVHLWPGTDGKLSPYAEGTPISIAVMNGKTYGELPVPTRSGYTFDGWFTRTGGVKISATDMVDLSADQYLDAHWSVADTPIPTPTPKTYTVTFHANEGSVSVKSKSVTAGQLYGELPTPTREDHIFDGWYTSAIGGTRITSFSAVELTADQTLYAHWITDPALIKTCSFWANIRSSGHVEDREVILGKPYGELPTLPSGIKAGYIFDGWYTNVVGGAEITSSSIVDFSGDCQRLYAHWLPASPKTFTVYFDYVNGQLYPTTKKVTTGATYGELPVPTRDGYIFDGWYMDDFSGGGQITSDTKVTLEANQTMFSGAAQHLTSHWKKSESIYVVTFDPNGGSVSTNRKTVTVGQTYGELPIPTRTGYTFDGWYTFRTSGTRITESATVGLSADQTLYARWTQGTIQAKTCTITFHANGGSVSAGSKTVTTGQTYGPLPTPTRTGYTFDGWYTARASGTKITEDTAVIISANQTLYAHWTQDAFKTFTVTFHADGGSVSPQSKVVTTGQSYGTLPTPTRSGYTFDGWYTAQAGGTRITGDTTVSLTGSQTLYARWSAKSFNVTFDPNGGSVTTKNIAVTAGQPYGTLPTPTREGYTFVGWFTDGMGGTQVTAASTFGLSTDQTLYAHWTAYQIYTVTLDPQGGTVEPGTKSVTEKGTYGDLPTPQREGYEFLGWYTALSGGKRVYSSTRITERDHALYARWKAIPPKTFTVTFNASGGTVSPKSRTVTEKQPYGQLPTPTRTGYTFDGWFTSVTGGQIVTADDTVSLTANQTLYAHWTLIPPKTYTVTFDPNEGAVADGTKVVTVGETYGTLPVPTRESHTFEGWYTAKENGTKVESYTKVALEADQTLYAHWKRVDKAFVVTLDPTGGAVNPTSLTLKGLKPYGTLPAPTRAGYISEGWYTAREGGEKVTAATVPSREEDHTLYAHWTARSFTVTLNANGGQLSGGATRTLTFGGSYGALPTPTQAGYTFDGWYTSKTGGSKVTADTLFTATGNQTLYAHWTAGSYTVTLDAMGGEVEKGSLTVTSGRLYGSLPTPTRPGHTFDGWYTAQEGGSKITAYTPVTQTQDHTLYARWRARTYTVYLKATDWLTYDKRITVAYGSPYGSLYTPTRNGYTFDGWYTAQEGGERVTESTVFSRTEDQYLYARWKSFTVRFDPNGGTVSTQSKSVVGGTAYGALPTPTRTGYTFEGWYTAREGGSLVTDATTASITGDVTLYAHWLQNGPTPTRTAMTYSFGNNQSYYGYPRDYRIPYERYVTVLGDNAYARDVYDNAGLWGGNCYGMSTSASLLYQANNGISPSSFRSNASKASQLKVSDKNPAWDMTLTEFIECMQISWYQPSTSEAYWRNENDLAKLCDAVRQFHTTGNHPVVLSLYGPDGGHAMVGYDLVDTGGSQARLMIYDPNYPNSDRYITLYKDSSGQYTGWYYKMNDSKDWGTEYPGCHFSFCVYQDFYQAWTDRAANTGHATKNLLRVNATQAVIQDANGGTVAEIRDGRLYTDREDIYEMRNIGVTNDGSYVQADTVAIWLPTDLYTITNQDETVESFEATMTNMDQSATVSTSASTVTFAVSDEQRLNYVEVNEAGKDYEITLNSTLADTHGEVALTGKTRQESTALAQLAGKLYATGTQLEGGERLLIDHQEASAETLSNDTGDLSLRLGRTGEEENDSLAFEDVAESAWYHDAVSYVCDAGLMNGTGKTAFGPEATTTRAMIATILYRLSGEPDAPQADFADVPQGRWYSRAVAWAAENGVAGGYGDGRFGPDDPITREQLAAMLYRFGGSPLTQGDVSVFRDAGEIGAYALDALRWASEKGIIGGKSGGLLDPKGQATRAEVAAILMRYCQLDPQ